MRRELTNEEAAKLIKSLEVQSSDDTEFESEVLCYVLGEMSDEERLSFEREISADSGLATIVSLIQKQLEPYLMEATQKSEASWRSVEEAIRRKIRDM